MINTHEYCLIIYKLSIMFSCFSKSILFSQDDRFSHNYCFRTTQQKTAFEFSVTETMFRYSVKKTDDIFHERWFKKRKTGQPLIWICSIIFRLVNVFWLIIYLNRNWKITNSSVLLYIVISSSLADKQEKFVCLIANNSLQKICTILTVKEPNNLKTKPTSISPHHVFFLEILYLNSELLKLT